MSACTLVEGDVTPGTLFYLRSWAVEGKQVRVASFRIVSGQLWWLPDPAVARAVAPRSFTVMLGGRPVAVRGAPEERLASKPSRLVFDVGDEAASLGADSGPMSLRPTRRAAVSFSTLVQRLSEGWETVDATLEGA